MHELKGKSFTEYLEILNTEGYKWIAKRLSGNDTGLTGGHQAGVYFPRMFFEKFIPEVNTTECHNPRVNFPCYMPQCDIKTDLRAIYYNSKHFPEKGLKKKYDEFRLTGWGGAEAPAQNSENTGCILIFAVKKREAGYQAVALVAESKEEDKFFEEWLGEPVDPGSFYDSDRHLTFNHSSEDQHAEIPREWLDEFPTGRKIYEHIVELLPHAERSGSLDRLLLQRRAKEFELFEIIEKFHVQPHLKEGFETLDKFLSLALSVANRRKSRSGMSLELNLESIFKEERLIFETQAMTETRKKPDFLFPSASAYHDPEFERSKLKMLAAKTCCKDRWRQVLSEANKIEIKHLFTLQEGVSTNQLTEMDRGGLQLVVPEPNRKSFPRDWRRKILTLEEFISTVRQQQLFL
ncbi:type II restriction endonuclease [Oceaniferula spumae]|uniref:Type II restriction endonuclease n=1 Tax=Oceaniferula spumae TaxID=2979115 RepID=A0AAT9FHP6_9BACT